MAKLACIIRFQPLMFYLLPIKLCCSVLLLYSIYAHGKTCALHWSDY